MAKHACSGLLKEKGNTIFSCFFVLKMGFHLPGKGGKIDTDDVLLEDFTAEKWNSSFTIHDDPDSTMLTGSGS
jgi:hypothetical protein